MRYKISKLFILPSLAIYSIIMIFPMFYGFYYSLTDWNGIKPKYNFVGLSNFVKMITDERLINSVKVTLIFVVAVVLIVNIFGLLFAVLLNNAGKLTNLYRSAFFAPIVLSSVAVAYVWSAIYSYYGMLNSVLDYLGMDFLKLNWLSDPKISVYSMIAVESWGRLGFHMVLFLAALQTIPKELYESAEIDGCNAITKFKHITLPLIVPGATVSIILSTIAQLKQYDIVKILTDGGPGFSTETITYNIMERAFQSNMQGYASAIAFILFVVIVLITMIQNMWLQRKEVDN
jgi:ABC-type sugar transport system permease subunit